MDQYILNLLPRIIEAGKKLNQIESIVDKVWVKYGEEDYETYRFRRNNITLVSLAGIVEERKWEILPPNGLYISKDGRGLMYRQAVVFESIILVQLESKKYQPVIFFDEAKIPDGDIVRYLTMLFSKQNISESPSKIYNLDNFVEKTFQTTAGFLVIKQKYYDTTLINSEAYILNMEAPNMKYITVNDNLYKWIKVTNGKVSDFEMH